MKKSCSLLLIIIMVFSLVFVVFASENDESFTIKVLENTGKIQINIECTSPEGQTIPPQSVIGGGEFVFDNLHFVNSDKPVYSFCVYQSPAENIVIDRSVYVIDVYYVDNTMAIVTYKEDSSEKADKIVFENKELESKPQETSEETTTAETPTTPEETITVETSTTSKEITTETPTTLEETTTVENPTTSEEATTQKDTPIIERTTITNTKITKNESPKTGDDSNMLLWLMCIALSLANVLGISVFMLNKRRG